MVKKRNRTFEHNVNDALTRPVLVRRRGLLLGAGLVAMSPAIAKLPAPDFAVGQGIHARQRLRAGLLGLGGLDRFVTGGARVLIKPNAGYARGPAAGVTTSPELLAALIVELRAVGARHILVADHPVDDAVGAFEASGLLRVCKALDVPVRMPSGMGFDPALGPAGCSLFAAALEGVHVIVNLANAKAHPVVGVGGAMTNLLGLLGGERAGLHGRLAGVLPEVAQLVRPQLSIVDGGQVMLAQGPAAGTAAVISRTPWLAVGTDPARVDAWVWRHLLRRQDALPAFLSARSGSAPQADQTG